ncbi:Mbov_0397 family ICE element conjugal transfer ATPase [Mesoplasma melaleucae]|uniref:Transfer complex protein TrsE n=1 Tax=Mesoplasma melaleucae TaxID=81459 RepID=A0A2K8NVH4_9MOLU|nr:VirB4 family type IV secretion system protein [Mesoplasma melaleucae]ATZ17819.1 transfer complex protein TrsE [Mesoplasma melaleucae]
MSRKRAYIPKTLNNVIKMSKNNNWFTMYDLLFCFVFLIVALIFVFTLSILGIIGQIFVGIIVFFGLFSMLLPTKVGRNLRVYQVIWKTFKFSSEIKKFKINTSNDTKNLVSFKKIIDDGNDISKFVLTKSSVGGKPFMASAVKIVGYDLFRFSEEEQNLLINNMQNLFMNIESNMSLIKVDRPLDLQANKKFWKRKLELLEKNKKEYTDIQYQTRKEQIQGFINLHEKEGSYLSSDNLDKEFYFVIYSTIKKKLMKNIYELMQAASTVKLKAEHINACELVNVYLGLVNPMHPKLTDQEIMDHRNDLDKLLAFNDLKVNGKYLCANNDKDLNKLYLNISNIKQYPNFPTRSWLASLVYSNSNFVININDIFKEDISKKLSNQLQVLNSNIVTHSKKDLIGKSSQEKDAELIWELIDDLASGNEKIKKINTYIISYSNNLKQLQEYNQMLRKTLKNERILIDDMTFNQLEGFSGAIIKPTDEYGAKYATYTPTLALAESFPFLSSDLRDEEGTPLGNNELQDVVVLDTFVKTRSRMNHNAFLTGFSGAGKTTALKVLMNGHLAKGGIVRAIDPENEYSSMARKYGGIVIDAGTGREGRINPLQPLIQLIDDENHNLTSNQIIQYHIEFFETWLKILFGDRRNINEMAPLISFALGDLYQQPKYKKVENILDQKAEWYPTFTDLIKFIRTEQKANKKYQTDGYEESVNLLENSFVDFGKYSELYNGPSVISIKNKNDLIVYNIQSLLEKSKNLQQAQMTLITAVIQNEVKINSLLSDKRIMVLIDEAHLLIDERNTAALDFIFQLVKRIRKRNGGVVLATQNLEDFFSTKENSKKTMAIVTNSLYVFVGKTPPQNIETVEEMYKSIGGLTISQREFLLKAESGQFILRIGSDETHNINFVVTKDLESVIDAKVEF